VRARAIFCSEVYVGMTEMLRLFVGCFILLGCAGDGAAAAATKVAVAVAVVVIIELLQVPLDDHTHTHVEIAMGHVCSYVADVRAGHSTP